MKTLSEIKRAARNGDYETVGGIVEKSSDLVKKVIEGLRTDHHNIQKTFSDLLKARQRLADRERRRRERKKERQARA